MPEPSPQSINDWISWHMQQVNILAWWQVLWKVPSQEDLQEFARRVWASFQLQRQVAVLSKWRMTTLHCPHPTPCTGTISCPSRICCLEARTFSWSSHKRPWPMQRPSSIGWKKPSHWSQANLTNWWEVCWSFDVRWNPWWCLLMKKSWKTSNHPIGWGSHCPSQQSLPKGNTEGAECATCMLEGHFGSLWQRIAKGLDYHSDGK